jgi:hypothetical protein
MQKFEFHSWMLSIPAARGDHPTPERTPAALVEAKNEHMMALRWIFFCRLVWMAVLGGLFGIAVPHAATAQSPAWIQLTTVEAVHDRYPSKVERLLSSLDLEAPELAAVRGARRARRSIPAARKLLNYYRTTETDPWLRNYATESDEGTYIARQILQGTYRFQGVSDTVPQAEDGGLKWTHDGPEDDKEWAFALNRHYHIEKLLEAYLTTGKESYARRLDQDLRDWIVHSWPYPAKEQDGPIWRGLEVAFRIERWVKVFFALRQTDHLQPGTRLLMLMSIQDHAHYLRHFHSDRNWVTMELSALGLLAAAWPEYTESSARMTYATQTLSAELDRQVYPDGAQKELASSYHWIALSNFEQFYTLRNQIGDPLPGKYRRNLVRMYEYLVSLLRPNGAGPLNNDSDLRFFKEKVLEAADRYGRPDWRYVATQGRSGKPPDLPPSRAFPWAGQLVSRDGWTKDAQWSFFDIGPWGTGHQHNDKLHLSVHAFGRDVLVDSGRFAYDGAVARRFRATYGRHSRGHNVVLIDGQGQAPGPKEASAPLGDDQLVTTDAYDFARGHVESFTGLPSRVGHKRALLYRRGEAWVVVDRITTDQPRTIETLWHFHPDRRVEIDSASVYTTDGSKTNLHVIPSDKQWEMTLVNGREEPVPQGWYSARYNRYSQATAAVASRTVDGTSTFAWLIVPVSDSDPVAYVRVLDSSESEVTMRYRIGEDEHTAVIPLNSSGRLCLPAHSPTDSFSK